MFNQEVKNQDPYIKYDTLLDRLSDTEGYDVDNCCSHRSLKVQDLTNFDINFGVVFIKSSLTNNPIHKTNSKLFYGYTPVWLWHVWNENDDVIYDSFEALKSRCDNPNLDVDKLHTSYVDCPINFLPCLENKNIEDSSCMRNMDNIIKNSIVGINWLEGKLKGFTHKMKKPDLIYFGGICLDDTELGMITMGEEYLNFVCDSHDYRYGWTGDTQTHIVK